MTREERWALPIGNDEYVSHLEEEFYRLRQVERTLDAQVEFLRSERDRLKDAVEELRVRNNNLLSSEEDEIKRLRLALEKIADPEYLDANWKAMRKVAKNALGSS